MTAAPVGFPAPAPRATTARRGGRPTLEEAAELDRSVRDCALSLFLEHGYEGTSMDAIARAAGTTKASLYTRFASKDDVFISVLQWAIGRSDWPVRQPAPPDLDDLEAALTAIADTALRWAVDPSVVQLGRIAIAQASRFPDLARRMHSAGLFPRQQLVVDLLNRHAGTGTIVADYPEILAQHFLAMVAGIPARLASFGLGWDAADLDRNTQVAVRLFLRGLRPD
jgi:AcrR family transcriptional regulator